MQIDTDTHDANPLDLLIVIAENLRLIFLGSLFIGLVSLGLSFILPTAYTSQAVLLLPANAPTNPPATPQQSAFMMVSPLVLDQIIRKSKLYGGDPNDAVRANLSKRVKAVATKDGLLRLSVAGDTPVEAQELANSIINTWLENTLPTEKERLDMVKRLEKVKFLNDAMNSRLARLTAKAVADANNQLKQPDSGSSIREARELQVMYSTEVLQVEGALRGLTRDVVKQAPNLPTEPSSPQRRLITLLAFSGGFFLMLVCVLLRNSWVKASKNPAQAARLAKLVTALRSQVGLR